MGQLAVRITGYANNHIDPYLARGGRENGLFQLHLPWPRYEEKSASKVTAAWRLLTRLYRLGTKLFNCRFAIKQTGCTSEEEKFLYGSMANPEKTVL